MPKIFPEDTKREGGQSQKNVGSPIDMLVNTVSHMQRDLAILLDENRALRTPAASQVIQTPRRVALTTTKVPRFDGTTSWEQYHQVFEEIVQSNGWDNDTAALQLFSHLEGDALNVAHLVPLARRLSRSGLVDYRRQFERTTRKVGEHPAIFAMALETLAVKASDCRVWESHADPITCRTTKPTPDMTYPTYAVGHADKDREVIKVAAVTGVRSDQNQLHNLLRRIVSAVEWPTPTPEISDVKKLWMQLSRAPPEGPAPVVDTPVPPTLEQLLRDVLNGQRRRQ